MKLNGGKFLVLRYGEDQNIKDNTLYFTGEMEHVIMQVDQCKDLGVTMQDNATFATHIDNVIRKVKQKS